MQKAKTSMVEEKSNSKKRSLHRRNTDQVLSQGQLPKITLQQPFLQQQAELDQAKNKSPSLDLQGKAIIDQQQLLNKCSLETLQRIRAQVVMAPNANTVHQIKNQFQPLSQMCKHQTSGTGSVSVTKLQATHKSPRGSLQNDQSAKKLPWQGVQTMEFAYNSMPVEKMVQKDKSPIAHASQKKEDTELDSGDDSQRKLIATEMQIGPTGTDNSRRNSKARTGILERANSSQQIPKLKEQIQDEALIDQEDLLKQVRMQIEQNDDDIVAQTFLVSKSQLQTPLATVQDSAHASSDLNLNGKVIGKRKEIICNNQKHKTTNVKQTVKKVIKDERQQQRQLSQAQRQNRNSLVTNTKPGARHVTAGKTDQGSNQRPIPVNSPLMQPPPQILQSKIIIHLLKTEYPLIEQVAKNEMGWRVTKSENLNAEFDIFWNDIGIDTEKLQSLKPYQKVNHFPAMFQITRKAFLAKNLKRLQKLYPLEFDFFPQTWVLPNELTELRAIACKKPKKPKDSSPGKKQALTTNQNFHNPTAMKNTTSYNNPSSNLNSAATTKAKVAKPAIETQPAAKQTSTAVVSPNNTQRNAPLSSHDEIARNGFKLSQVVPMTMTTRPTNVESVCASAHNTADEETEESVCDEENESEESEESETATVKPAAPLKEVAQNKRAPVLREQRKAPLPNKQKTVTTRTKFPMIIKPDCSSQGKGIFLTNDLDNVPKDDIYVVQQYMQNPYLLDGLKFDLRLYVLVLSCEPLKIFLYEEGLVRFATQKFQPLDAESDKNDFNNFFMHLTNYAINKESEQFRAAKSIHDDTGHKRTLTKVLERLSSIGEDPDRIMGEIKDVIIKTLISIQQELIHNYRNCQPTDLESLMCFEILGFDIILDDKCKPILLEVNQAPSFATDSPLDYDIKRGLFIDTFRLLGLSVEKKKLKLKRIYEDKKDRMLNKLTLKQKNIMRKQAINQFQKEQEVFEQQNNGRFERIFPLPVREAAESNRKSQGDDCLSQSNKQLAQSQYQALMRQQERYNQLLATLSNTDIDKAVKAKNRLEKEEKESSFNTKIRVKKVEKKRMEPVLNNARNNQFKKITSLLDNPAQQQPQHLVIQVEQTVDQAIPNSETQSIKKLEQQFSNTIDSKNAVNDRQNSYRAGEDGQNPKTASYQSVNMVLKPNSQQYSHIHQNASNFRGSINLDHQNLKQLVELQQKIGLSSPIIFPHGTNQNLKKYKLDSSLVEAKTQPKTTQFNFINIGLGGQHGQSMNSRAGAKKNANTIIAAVLKAPQAIEGLKPSILQLQYNSASQVSQSQNPINLTSRTLKSNTDYPEIMNQTQSNKQGGNLLPNIAKNMIPAEKSSMGFASGQSSQQNEFTAGRNVPPNLRQAATDSLSCPQKPVAAQAAMNKDPDQMSQNRQGACSEYTGRNSTGIGSPRRANFIDRTQLQRSSIQNIKRNQPLVVKTQQMNLNIVNIQPVIIDSNNLNNHDESQQQPKSPSLNIPMGGGSSYKTQKFSKIQLQSIIDNLYQYEPPKCSSDASMVVHSLNSPTPQDLSIRHHSSFKPVQAIHPSSYLPDVKQNLEQQKNHYLNVANIAMNAIATAKAKSPNPASLRTNSEQNYNYNDKPASPKLNQLASSPRSSGHKD